MKRFGKIVLFLFLLVSVLTLVSCQDSTVGEISVQETGMPQLVFVLGEELDLSNGVLTVTKDGESSEVSLTAEGVTVSGYDKNKLGEQTITITYGGATTELKITVVERMTAQDYIVDYLVGDVIDLSKGRLKITRNDGTTYTVVLNSNKVTVEGFDSSAAGSVSLKVRYADGGESYECTVPVTIYDVDEVVLHAPNKVTYDSHETELNLAGGYLTLKGNGGKLEKDIPLTAEGVVISGFDSTAVTEENTPLTQKIKVTYNQKDYEYSIKLTYTETSFILANIDRLKGLDFSGEEDPEISEELGELALEMIQIYLDMSKADQAAISKEDSLQIARTAMVYGFNRWAETVLLYNDAFAIEYGEFVFKCKSYEAVENALEGLLDEESDLYTLGPVLIQMMELFGSENVSASVTFADYPVLDTETCETLVDIFEYMLGLSTLFSQIPDQWETVGVNHYAAEIQGIYDYIMAASYTDTSLNEIYYHVSLWRTKDDAFEILYTYYYGQQNTDALVKLASIRLPKALEEIYTYVGGAMQQIQMMQQQAVMDSSEFFYDYYMAVKLSELVKAQEGTMANDLYYMLPVNSLLGLDTTTYYYFDTVIEYLRTAEGGYYSFAAGLLGMEAFEELMDAYMNIIMNLFGDPNYEESAQYQTDVEAMFHLYMDLSPAQQSNFLSTLHIFYSMGYPEYVFDDSEESAMFASVFVTMINDYYKGKLNSEQGIQAYKDLILATEIYANRFNIENWLEEFKTRIDAVKASYAAMTAVDKAVFDQYLGDIFEKYSAICARFQEPTAPEIDFGEWQDEFEKLYEAIINVEIAYYLGERSETPVYAMFFSAYEKAMSLAEYILENAPAHLIDAYYHENLYTYGDLEDDGAGESGTTIGGGESEKVQWSFDYAMSLYRGVYISYQATFMGIGIYDMYEALDMGTFLEQCYDVVWTYLYGDDDPATLDFDRAKVLAAMKTLREMDLEAQTLFIVMEGEDGYYYYAIDAFIQEAFTENAAKVAYKMLELEQQCMLYMNMQDQSELASLQTLLSELQTLYAQLEGADKVSFADLEEAYSFYCDKAEALLAEAAA